MYARAACAFRERPQQEPTTPRGRQQGRATLARETSPSPRARLRRPRLHVSTTEPAALRRWGPRRQVWRKLSRRTRCSMLIHARCLGTASTSPTQRAAMRLLFPRVFSDAMVGSSSQSLLCSLGPLRRPTHLAPCRASPPSAPIAPRLRTLHMLLAPLKRLALAIPPQSTPSRRGWITCRHRPPAPPWPSATTRALATCTPRRPTSPSRVAKVLPRPSRLRLSLCSQTCDYSRRRR